MIGDAVYAKCDDLDGVKDGIISNVLRATSRSMSEPLRCPDGSTRRHRLSDAQLRPSRPSLRNTNLESPLQARMSSRNGRCSKASLFQGPSNFGQCPTAIQPDSRAKKPLLYVAGDQTSKFIITRDPISTR